MDNEEFGVEKKSWYFFRYQELVIDDELLCAYDKATYGAICKYADSDTGLAYPSLNTLAKKAGCSKNRMIKSLETLIKAGYITKRKRKEEKKNKSNIYKVLDLAYINNALKHAKDDGDEELEKKIKKRLEKHPIPKYKEIIDIVHGMNKGSARDEQGVVRGMNHPSARDEHELELKNYNQLNDIVDDKESAKEAIEDMYNKIFIKKPIDNSYHIVTLMRYLEQGVELDLMLKAMHKTGLSNNPNMNYLEDRLNRWLKAEITSISDLEASQQKPKTARGGKNNGKRSSSNKKGFSKSSKPQSEYGEGCFENPELQEIELSIDDI